MTDVPHFEAAVARICGLVIDREPITLGEFEAILGFPVPRVRNQPWRARVKDPIPGIDHVYAAFVGAGLEALRDDPDPRLDEIGLGAPGVDCAALAVALLGDRDGHTWQRGSGELAVRDGYLSWTRAVPAGPRTEAEATELVANLAAMLDRDITFATLAEIFGAVRVEGRRHARCVRGPSWCVSVPLPQDPPYNVTIQLDPPLPCAPLFAALGWHDVVIDDDQQRVLSALDGRSRWYPVSDNGFLVHVAIHEPAGIERGHPYATIARRRSLFTHHLYLTRRI